MTSLTEKIVATIVIAIPGLLVLFTTGRRGPTTPAPLAMFYAVIDWRLIRQIFFRHDDSWRPLAKGVLLTLLVVALVCVWVA